MQWIPRSPAKRFFGRERDLDVDAVEERTRNLCAIGGNLTLRAAAGVFRIIGITARTGVHRGHEHETGWKVARGGHARDGHVSVLKRLAHDFKNIASEFGKLVKEQHAAMRERHLAGHGMRAAAEQPRVGNGVVRRTERTAHHKRLARLQNASNGVDARNLQCLLGSEGREDGRNAPREHRLARAGRPDHEDVVSARNGHLDCALRAVLSLHVREVIARVAVRGHACGEVRAHRVEGKRAGEKIHRLAQAADGIDVDALYD